MNVFERSVRRIDAFHSHRAAGFVFWCTATRTEGDDGHEVWAGSQGKGESPVA